MYQLFPNSLEAVLYDEGDALELCKSATSTPPRYDEYLDETVTYKCIYQYIDTSQTNNHVLMLIKGEVYTILIPKDWIEKI